MAETFYSVLGVDPDADDEAIERAYRERVKESHPDVSDDPEAPREFKRLTTARDVLVDETERERYDRLGHATYVEDHVAASAWSVRDPDGRRAGTDGRRAPGSDRRTEPTARHGAGSGPDGGATAAERSPGDGTGTDGGDPVSDADAAPGTTGDDRTAWLGEDGPTDSGGGASTGEYGDNGWETAAAYHRVEPSPVRGRDPLWRRAARVGRRVGPWALVHLVFVSSAVATTWFVYSGATYLDVSGPALVGVSIVLVSAVLTSAIHLLTRVYA